MRTVGLRIFILFLLSVNALAQQQIPKKYNGIKDTAEISKLLILAHKYQFSNPDSFIYYLDIAQELAEKTNSKLHQIKSFLFRGSFYLTKGEYQKALDNFFVSQDIAKQMGNEYWIAYTDMSISSGYLFLAYYPLAEKHLIKALEYYDKINNKEGLANVYLNMTFIKVQQKDYEQAKKTDELAYKHYIDCNDLVGITRALANFCDIEFNLKNYELALEKGRKALLYSKLSNQLFINSLIYQNIGGIYAELNLLDSAHYYYNKSISSAKIWDDSYVIAKCKQGIAEIYARQNQTDKALSNALESYQIANKKNIVQLKAEAASLLALNYSKRGNYKAALEFKTIESQINDSLFTKEKYKVQNEMEAIYQNQKNESTISSLSKEKEIEILKNRQSKYYIGSLLALILILTFTSLLVFRNIKLNALSKTIVLEQRLLRTQMNPHFIFNALSSIQEYIMDKKPIEASSYLSGFATLMRSILINSSREFIPLEDEIETLKHYLQLQKLRFPDKLDYEIIVSDNLEINELVIPPMLSQPFIENSVNHGIAKLKEGNGKVTVEFFEKNNSLMLRISDNGVGMQAAEAQNSKKHESKAIQITKNRIDHFQKTYKKGVYFEIGNIFNEKYQVAGVQVIFQFPKKYLEEL